MSTAAERFAAFQTIYPNAELVGPQEQPYAYIPELVVKSDGQSKTIGVLVQPWADGGYTSRVYFSEKFSSKGANWNTSTILANMWWVCSWNNVPASVPWSEILINHLTPLL